MDPNLPIADTASISEHPGEDRCAPPKNLGEECAQRAGQLPTNHEVCQRPEALLVVAQWGAGRDEAIDPMVALRKD
jgi:hypothetical protein